MVIMWNEIRRASYSTLYLGFKKLDIVVKKTPDYYMTGIELLLDEEHSYRYLHLAHPIELDEGNRIANYISQYIAFSNLNQPIVLGPWKDMVKWKTFQNFLDMYDKTRR